MITQRRRDHGVTHSSTVNYRVINRYLKKLEPMLSFMNARLRTVSKVQKSIFRILYQTNWRLSE